MLPVEGSITPIRDRVGKLGGCIFVFRDVSQTRALAQQLRHQAEHDPLTGLPNRGRFEQELAARLSLAQVRGLLHAVLYLDLDRFTLINDTCGHQDGDRLLLLVARELGTRLRPGDVLARIGDDKFGVILDGCNAERALQKAVALVEAVDRARFRVGERVFQLGLSVGVAGIDASAEDARQVLMQADTACYVAKRLGGSRAQMYQNNDLEVSRTRKDMDWVAPIELALDENRIELFAQRIVPLEGGSAPCYELLVRLRLPDGSFAQPNDFLPAAQRFGLMDKIERSVVRQALDKIDRLQRHGGGNDFGYLSVNLSGTSLSDQGFTDFLLRELERHATPPERVRFEITETAALNETAGAKNLHRQPAPAGLQDPARRLRHRRHLVRLPQVARRHRPQGGSVVHQQPRRRRHQPDHRRVDLQDRQPSWAGDHRRGRGRRGDAASPALARRAPCAGLAVSSGGAAGVGLAAGSVAQAIQIRAYRRRIKRGRRARHRRDARLALRASSVHVGCASAATGRPTMVTLNRPRYPHPETAAR